MKYKLIQFRYKGYSLYFIPLILAEKTISDITIKDYIDPRIIDNVILNIYPKTIMKPFMFSINTWFHLEQE